MALIDTISYYMPSSGKAGYFYIRVKLMPKLAEKHRIQLERHPNTKKDLGGFINDMLDIMLKKDDFIRQYSPDLILEGYNSNTLFIRNSKTGIRYEVYRHDKQIKCERDNSFDCDHIHFALALPEVANLDLKKPFKK